MRRLRVAEFCENRDRFAGVDRLGGMKIDGFIKTFSAEERRARLATRGDHRAGQGADAGRPVPTEYFVHPRRRFPALLS